MTMVIELHVRKRNMWPRGLFCLSEGVKETGHIGFWFRHGWVERSARYWYPLAQMTHEGGSMIPHVQDNQQYNSFPPLHVRTNGGIKRRSRRL